VDPNAGLMVQRIYPRLVFRVDSPTRRVDTYWSSSRGYGSVRVGLASRGSLLEQLAELDLCRSFGLACLPQPDAMANAVADRDPAAGVIFHSDYAEVCVKPRKRGVACAGGVC
jgi:hypothetical protein